jgi:hypothetical protein
LMRTCEMCHRMIRVRPTVGPDCAWTPRCLQWKCRPPWDATPVMGGLSAGHRVVQPPSWSNWPEGDCGDP